MPYSGLADCLTLSANWGWIAPMEIIADAKTAAQNAIKFDSELAEAHTSLAGVALLLEWDWQQVEEEFKRAIDLNSRYAFAHHVYGFYLLFMKRYEEAIAQWDQVLKLDPIVPFYQAAAGLPYYYMHQYDKAIDQYQKALELEPNFHAAHYYLGCAYIDKKMYQDATEEIEKAIEFLGPSPDYLGALSLAYSLAGRKSDALKVLGKLQELEKNGFVSFIAFATAYMGLDDRERAIEYFQKSFESHDFPSLPEAMGSKMFDSLRNDPRFQEISRKMNLPQKPQVKP